MADLAINGADTAATALGERWRRLAETIEEARRLKEEVARDPSLANDPWVVARVRWLSDFERDLAAVQKVYEALGGGGKLAEEDIRAASDAAQGLLEIITEARSRTREPEPA